MQVEQAKFLTWKQADTSDGLENIDIARMVQLKQTDGVSMSIRFSNQLTLKRQTNKVLLRRIGREIIMIYELHILCSRE